MISQTNSYFARKKWSAKLMEFGVERGGNSDEGCLRIYMLYIWMRLPQEVNNPQKKVGVATNLKPIGLYRDVWIAAIASSTTSLATRTAAICVRFQGRRVRRVYVTMQITFLTRKSALIYRRGLRQRVASLTLNCNGDFAIRACGDVR